jgi:ankyrin repeat protein
MCRFGGLDDVEYKKVAAALCRITTAATRRQPTTPEAGQSLLSEEEKRLLLASLKFDQIDARQMTIKKAHAQTCKGKPGTGKSTLMKFALANARKTMRDTIVISFFFNARGDDLEKSTVGMYRSLLLQLLERVPVSQDVFNSLELRTWNGGYYKWGIEALKALFEEIILGLGELPVTCFIDALDECDEDQIRDMVSFFENVGGMTTEANPPIKFQVCFSSRHYPNIKIARGLKLVLEGQEEHSKDIARYLGSELKIGHSTLAEQIRTDLQEKALGVFMWVVLVVEILNKEHDAGRIHALRQRLREIPGDLHKLFRDILTRDQHNRGELLLCVQWVLFARKPLKPEQLYCAILSGVEPEALTEWDPEEITAAVMKRFILNSSKGLAEVTQSKSPTVQFIHESVKDFLLKENGLREIWSDLGGNFEGVSHERLKQCCLNYTRIDIAASLKIAGRLPTANTQQAAKLRESANQKFPLLEYATRNVLYHADAAEEGGISQLGFLHDFQLADWIKLDNLFERHEVRRHTAGASSLYILSESNLPALIKVHPLRQSCFQEEDERYGTPFFAALATDSDRAVEAFVEVCLETQDQESPLRDLCKHFSENSKKSIKIGRTFTFSRTRGALAYVMDQRDEAFLALFAASGQANARDENEPGLLWYAARAGSEAVVRLLLLEAGQVDAELKEKNWDQTPLLCAVKGGHEAIVRLLLDTGRVDVDSKDQYGKTALSWAAEEGYEPIIRLLLETGQVDVESKDNHGQTPLSFAAGNGHESVVRLLLGEGRADVKSKDNSGETPLLWASVGGYEAIVQLLLETGQVDVEAGDENYGQTPLVWAAKGGHEAVVRLLIEKGKADFGSKDKSGQTPLSWAARNGHEAVVRLLRRYNTYL